MAHKSESYSSLEAGKLSIDKVPAFFELIVSMQKWQNIICIDSVVFYTYKNLYA